MAHSARHGSCRHLVRDTYVLTRERRQNLLIYCKNRKPGSASIIYFGNKLIMMTEQPSFRYVVFLACVKYGKISVNFVIHYDIASNDNSVLIANA